MNKSLIKPPMTAGTNATAVVMNNASRNATRREKCEQMTPAPKPPTTIARVMGWTVNAVNVALSRARRAIRECVEVRLVEAST